MRTHAYTTVTTETHLGWVYYGLISNWDAGGVGSTTFESYRQGQFCLLNCLGGTRSRSRT
ncbi:MAG: hypothetical protein R2731_17855 [Nocardioides sp.]